MRPTPITRFALVAALALAASCESGLEPLPVMEVTLNSPRDTILIGQSIQVTARAVDVSGNALRRPMSWATSNATVAAVSDSGLVTARAAGVVTITATSEGVSGSADITVRPVPVASVEVTVPRDTIVVGQSVQLAAIPRDSIGAALPDRIVTWSSSDSAVAGVTATGFVTARASGRAVIAASSEGRNGVAPLTVEPRVATVMVDSAQVSLGRSVQMRATARDSAGTPLAGRAFTWVSQATDVATVSAAGVVTGVGVGSANITATSEGVSGTGIVTVIPGPPTSLTVIPGSWTLVIGGTVRLTASARDSAGNTLGSIPVTWTSRRNSVATIDTSGLVTAVAAGRDTIVATAGGLTASGVIIVVGAPARLTISPSAVTLQQLTSVYLIRVLEDSAGDTLSAGVTWVNGNPAVASIDFASPFFANVMGRTPGVDTITALAGSLVAWAVVTVVPGAPVDSVTVHPSTASLYAGATIQLTAVTWGAGGQALTGRVVRWASVNPVTATVDSITGLVTAVALGQATITATSEGHTATAAVTVQPPLGFAAVSAGFQHSCGITGGGGVVCWGFNGTGELGNGRSGGWVTTPAPVQTGLAFAMVSAGIGDFYEAHTCGLATTGAALCWGDNVYGELGSPTVETCFVGNEAGGGDYPCSSAPLPVTGGLTFMDLSTGASHTCGIATDGRAWCWGSNWSGALGTGDFVDRPSPTLVAGSLTFRSIRAGYNHTCALTAGGAAYCWGYGGNGALGDGGTVNRSAPVAVAGGLTFASLTAGAWHTCGVAMGGTAWCWGNNGIGQLGIGHQVSVTTPQAVQGGFAYTMASAGVEHTCGVRVDGMAFCWGSNFSGQLGTGDYNFAVQPAAVAGGLAFSGVTAGFAHSCGRSTSGVAYCWGENYSGQLGDGSTTGRLTPVKVFGQP